MIETNETLLERLRRADAHDAWREFYTAYRGAVLGYARRRGLRGPAVDEVLQDTFIALVRVLPTFRYDRARGRFRHYLLRIVEHRVREARKRVSRATSRMADLDGAEATEALLDHPHAREAEDEWRRAQNDWRAALAVEALARVRNHAAVGEHTMAVFEDYVIRGHTAPAVAAKHRVAVNAVYQIRHRTLARVQRELAFLLENAGEEPA